MKARFLKNEIWRLTISGAFQRANVYLPDTDENVSKTFRDGLRVLIVGIAEEYKVVVSEDVHLNNIMKVSDFEDGCLEGGHLNYGVSQKVLNLYLKYLWCLDLIPIPPHFPVDSRI